MPASAHVPARRLGAEEDEAAHAEGGQHGRTEHEPPVEPDDAAEVGHPVESQVGHVPEHDSERRPELPLHHERAPDGRGSRLGRVDRHRGRHGADAEPDGEARDEHVPPAVGEALPQHRHDRDGTRHEDRAPSPKPVVERHSHPAPDEGAAQVRRRIHQPQEPRRPRVVALDPEWAREEQLRAVDHRFVWSRGTGRQSRSQSIREEVDGQP